MSFFDSVKKSLGISKDKSDSSRENDSNAPFRQFEVTFTDEKLGIGISRYSGNMPHLAVQDQNRSNISCPVVTSFDSRKHGRF